MVVKPLGVWVADFYGSTVKLSHLGSRSSFIQGWGSQETAKDKQTVALGEIQRPQMLTSRVNRALRDN